MSNLLSSAERTFFTGVFDNCLDTFSFNRNIIVYKSPLKTEISPVPADGLFGFGENQTESLYSYEPVSGIFPAIVKYANLQDAKNVPELNINVFSGPVTIKVKKPARDFINNGQTDRIVIDERIFLLDGDEKAQTFLDSIYYIFPLRNTH